MNIRYHDRNVKYEDNKMNETYTEIIDSFNFS